MRTGTTIVGVLLVAMLMACQAEPQAPSREATAREAMVEQQLAARGIADEAVLDAMRSVERHRFVPARLQHLAYGDHPLPIGEDQTISQPYIVAYMTEALALKPGERVLEIGTGSGYQAAVLAELGAEVYTIEIFESLGRRAAALLRELRYTNVHVRVGDGYKGWAEHAPFDAIIVTCAPTHVPAPLREQLAEGGRMMIPVGEQFAQRLVRLRKEHGKLVEESDLPVRFVPMIDEDRERY